MGGLDLLTHHVAANRGLGEEDDKTIRGSELAVDLRHSIEADFDLLVEEDMETPRFEKGAKPFGELLVRKDVPVAQEDLVHSSTRNCSMARLRQ